MSGETPKNTAPIPWNKIAIVAIIALLAIIAIGVWQITLSSDTPAIPAKSAETIRREECFSRLDDIYIKGFANPEYYAREGNCTFEDATAYVTGKSMGTT